MSPMRRAALARSLAPLSRQLLLSSRAAPLSRRLLSSSPLEYASSCYLPTDWTELPLLARRDVDS